jgi:protein-S-isoprenylcysteine O-methyltransferase Ste14
MSETLWNDISWWSQIACWGIFCLIWLAGSVANYFKAPPAEQRTSSVVKWLIGIIGVLALNTLVPKGFWAALTFHTHWLQLCGLVTLLISLAFVIWSRAVLGTMWTLDAVVKTDHRLRTHGPYSLVRHPIYLGVLGMVFATMLLNNLGIWLAYFVLAIALFENKLTTEERLLEQTFGEEYRLYRQRVPQLIPGIKRLSMRPASGRKMQDS